MVTGKFITFEGGEGVGKTTQIRLLSDFLRNAGIETKITREPGGSPGAEEIRALLVGGETDRWDAVTETLLHFAARRDHINKIITPALKNGHWVLSDRFIDSTVAYQGYGHGVDIRSIQVLHQFVAKNLTPDMTIILDLPATEGIERANSRTRTQISGSANIEDRYERMAPNFHARLRKGFLEIAKKNHKRCVIVDSTRTIQTIQSEIQLLICERFGLHERQ